MKDNIGERNSAPTGASESVNEMNKDASDPLGVASCSASSLKWDVWVEPDGTGTPFLKLHASVKMDEFSMEWVEKTMKWIRDKNCNYLNPLFSSDPQRTDSVSIALRKASSSE